VNKLYRGCARVLIHCRAHAADQANCMQSRAALPGCLPAAMLPQHADRPGCALVPVVRPHVHGGKVDARRGVVALEVLPGLARPGRRVVARLRQQARRLGPLVPRHSGPPALTRSARARFGAAGRRARTQTWPLSQPTRIRHRAFPTHPGAAAARLALGFHAALGLYTAPGFRTSGRSAAKKPSSPMVTRWLGSMRFTKAAISATQACTCSGHSGTWRAPAFAARR